MAAMRRLEASQAIASLGASLAILNFPDLHLAFIPLENLIEAVLPMIRQHESDVIFSFDEFETTPGFDHPDHNIAGKVAKYVASAADVTHFKPAVKALASRPKLYLWTSQTKPKNQTLDLSVETRQARDEYLVKFHRSQFQVNQKNHWVEIFNQITLADGSNHHERYLKVR
jgi:LmbE family N-acetylglucosaminyl deacetylase